MDHVDNKDTTQTISSSDKASDTNEQDATLAAALANIFSDAKFPDANIVVTGALTEEKVKQAAAAGVEHIINLQPNAELTFDEQVAVTAHSIVYTHIPIANADDLKQLNVLEFDKALRAHHGKKTLLHCKTGNRVGACMALRAGWLRGRKMETALKTGQQYGLTSLEDEVRTRLLVPR